MASVRDSPLYEHLSAILVRERKAAGLKQVQLAERLGRPQSFISKYEAGEKRLDLVELLEVTGGIGCSAEAIVAELGRFAAPARSAKGAARGAPSRRSRAG